MVKIWRWNSDKKKAYSWDTSKGGSGISPMSASVESSTMVKQKDLLQIHCICKSKQIWNDNANGLDK
mgnify:CR=1 FL=1